MPGNLHKNDIRTVGPPDDIMCKDCVFRDDGTVWSHPYTKSNCQQYPLPGTKPIRVLTKKESCPKYRKDIR